ncbi:MAG: NAD-dependent epimerase/dehydratase family protein [Myxococcota bacterium]
MSRYLVTGATTPSGLSLLRELLRRRDTKRVIAIGHEIHREAPLRDGRLTYIRLDLTRERNVRGLVFGTVKEEQIESIVHMATHRGAPTGPRSRALNVDSAQRLLRFAERTPSVRRFVYRSYSTVFNVNGRLPTRMNEDHPLRIGPGTPEYVLQRVEADLAICARMGMSRIRIAVLRCAECLAPKTGSQLWDYLQAPICPRPVGFDPMLNVLSDVDLGRALSMAATSDAQGVFTIPGWDTLPLSRIVARFGKRDVPMPGPMIAALFGLRRGAGGTFRYAISGHQLHFGGILDGRRAEADLGYTPENPVLWPLLPAEIDRRALIANPRSLRGRIERLVTREK